ncbi:MAG: alpha/beta hydrolase [Verrucomicrobiales bacterium]|nr:alpha/beta hydrolase [Verrucomicrobiales bacterium]
MIIRSFFLLVLLSCNSLLAAGVQLENFDYPFPVERFSFKSQKLELQMAFMDLVPDKPNGEVAVLLHGKNFSGAYWEQTAKALVDGGYEVVIPDQIGFGKSSKPEHYQFTLQQLAENTHQLLRTRAISSAHIVGHSMGGMIATRYALMFPNLTRSLVLVDPLGLEDWRAKGVPYVSIDQAYEKELKQTRDTLQKYEADNYYGGKWKPEYGRWVDMLGEFMKSPEYAKMAWNQALTFDMIMTQPVCYEFNRLKMPVLLVIGQNDHTAIGKELVKEEVAKTLGNYPELGKAAASQMPNAKLVQLEGIGHLPHVEDFPRFIEPVKSFLKEQTHAEK